LTGARALAQSNQDLFESQREARQLALVARHANDSVIMQDSRGTIVWVNDAFVQTTGYSAAEAVGQSVGRLLNGDETSAETVAAIRAAVKDGRPLRSEILNYAKDGRKIWVETNIVPISDDRGLTETVIAIERDITDAKSHALEMTRATSRAKEGARAKAAFLATMSHEIRTPMNGIIGMSDLLSETALAPQQREYVSAIHTSAEALLRIINDILDYSKLDAGKMGMAEDPFNLARCIRMSADLLRGSARDKGLFLDICHDGPLPDVVVGDEGRVRQVLLNLLGNAIKFTDAGGVTLHVSVENKTASHVLRITVSDTGIGVPADRAACIFDQFEQADVATTRKYGGTGLGLAISRQLARRMGGNLELAPGDASGSVFVFTFEAGTPQKHDRAAPCQPEGTGSANLEGRKILLAEDNRTNSLLIARYLSDLEITLWFAGDGAEALDLVAQHRPNIVLMDMSMPVLDGISATQLIRQMDGPQPHIIALTANAFDSDRAACLAAGMDDFLPKPVRKADLLAALARCSRGDKPLGSPPRLRVSRNEQAEEAVNWTSQPASGTTSGRSTRSSGL
ncbi:PAS domain-containing hybrid sensor histidine kinase/response regulator, partial [Puniceibacterium confluentis]|uniref:PAS domain-containing hybrid sensor histidine kinase/response regulator n=1 Tax=Puniceibacterium confluentis TaxID=1958944 RepID=UPI00356582C6